MMKNILYNPIQKKYILPMISNFGESSNLSCRQQAERIECFISKQELNNIKDSGLIKLEKGNISYNQNDSLNSYDNPRDPFLDFFGKEPNDKNRNPREKSKNEKGSIKPNKKKKRSDLTEKEKNIRRIRNHNRKLRRQRKKAKELRNKNNKNINQSNFRKN